LNVKKYLKNNILSLTAYMIFFLKRLITVQWELEREKWVTLKKICSVFTRVYYKPVIGVLTHFLFVLSIITFSFFESTVRRPSSTVEPVYSQNDYYCRRKTRGERKPVGTDVEHAE